jgi:hypothetical protein
VEVTGGGGLEIYQGQVFKMIVMIIPLGKDPGFTHLHKTPEHLRGQGTFFGKKKGNHRNILFQIISSGDFYITRFKCKRKAGKKQLPGLPPGYSEFTDGLRFF